MLATALDREVDNHSEGGGGGGQFPFDVVHITTKNADVPLMWSWNTTLTNFLGSTLNLILGILVTSTTTGHDSSVVSALASEAKGAKGRVSIPSCDTSFFSHKYFPSSLSE